ncbi:MAG: hypothetical protein ACRCVG_08330 [Methanobacteriaceae archaeon]
MLESFLQYSNYTEKGIKTFSRNPCFVRILFAIDLLYSNVGKLAESQSLFC